ncbi:hypothetical protein F2Q70_00014442 [Brassica cretica]|uniref:Uncharacterized protein n=1 Tax=Brassica cretica TaxID=69181 RepID=A0A8S9KQ85_BRACR|nr:hypothetical protein F2Q70_00014442 [Brassica cretica]KAF2596569.1 hypothetical protein F2Q68_00007453 [Brassica cretica]
MTLPTETNKNLVCFNVQPTCPNKYIGTIEFFSGKEMLTLRDEEEVTRRIPQTKVGFAAGKAKCKAEFLAEKAEMRRNRNRKTEVFDFLNREMQKGGREVGDDNFGGIAVDRYCWFVITGQSRYITDRYDIRLSIYGPS